MSANRRLVPLGSSTIAFGSMTNSFQDASSQCNGRGVIIVITNTLNSDTTVSLDGGATSFIVLPAGQGLTLDLSTNDGEFSGKIQVKYTTGAPTAGFICCGIVRVQ